jgi:hypothetical protein
MKLRGKIILWLLPTIIPLLVYNLFQYYSQIKSLEVRTQRVISLTSSASSDEINGFLWLALNSFDSLTKKLNTRNLSFDKLDNQAIKHFDVTLRTFPQFSLLALLNVDGTIAFSHMAPIKSNQHTLPRKIQGKQLLQHQHLSALQNQYMEWLKNRPEMLIQLNTININLSSFIDNNQFNAESYRRLQHQYAKLSVNVDQPPKNIVLGGGDVSKMAGLPFQENTYLFTTPALDSNHQLTGYIVAILDWTQIEDILF